MRVLRRPAIVSHRMSSHLQLVAGGAILEVLKERGIGQVLPILCLREQLPAPVRDDMRHSADTTTPLRASGV